MVMTSQAVGGAGLAAGVTVGALLAEQMVGGERVAGIPAALLTLGSALAAFSVGWISQRAGRRMGLTIGFLLGAVGAIGVVLAAMINNLPVLFVALFVYGAGTAANLQARYAATDLAPSQSRATAVSIAMVATTLGAVAGPTSVVPLGDLAQKLGIPALAGPFLLAAVAFTVAATVIFGFLRPDPLILARESAVLDGALPNEPGAEREGRGTNPPLSPRNRIEAGVMVGTTIMVLTQVVMVAIMTMTPVHMRHNDHTLGAVGFVIGMHVAAMFLPSLITGQLVDRLGRRTIALAAGATLMSAGIFAAIAPGNSVGITTFALVLLGLGWNFGLISGTALIVDSAPLQTRARTQGTIDVLIAIAGAGGGAISGIVVDATSYDTLALAGGFLALLLMPVVARSVAARSANLRQPSPIVQSVVAR